MNTLNSFPGMSNMFGVGQTGMMSGASLNLNIGLFNGMDSASMSSAVKDPYGMASFSNPFGNCSSGLGNLGMGMGMGMVPGFGGSCNQMGSMFGGMMQGLQQQQQMMMMMMMQMMQMMMQMMQSNGMGIGSAAGGSAAGGTGAATGSSATGGTGSATSASGSSAGEKIANAAMKWDKTAFKAGQSRRCADWVSTVLEESGAAPAGFKHQTGCGSLQKYGSKVEPNVNNLQAGDLVYFRDTYTAGEYTHVGIYVGNGKFIHRCTSNKTVQTDSLTSGYWKDHFSAARRI